MGGPATPCHPVASGRSRNHLAAIVRLAWLAPASFGVRFARDMGSREPLVGLTWISRGRSRQPPPDDARSSDSTRRFRKRVPGARNAGTLARRPDALVTVRSIRTSPSTVR